MALTVVGEHLAKPGAAFTYLGETDPGCVGCKLRKQCHTGLKVGRDYRVKSVRPVKHEVCHVFEGKVQLVDLEPVPLPVRVTIPVSALRGTGFTPKWEDCGAACLYKAQCDPAGLRAGTTAQIVEVGGDVPCLVGRKLKFATVRPPGEG